MPMISGETKDRIAKQLEPSLSRNVRLVLFTQDDGRPSNEEARSLIQEITALSSKVVSNSYDFTRNSEEARKLKVDKSPAIAVMSENEDFGIRFYGVPGGYELKVLVEDIIRVSRSDSGLSEETKKTLASIDKPVHIQVFVTPTCPYCPSATTIAHQLAQESRMISADMVEVTEFPQLAQKYGVMSVPKVVINESEEFTGALPERKFLEKILKAIKNS